MAQGAWCYRRCPYGRPGNAVYCGSEDENGNCPSSCDCPERADTNSDFDGSLPQPPSGFERRGTRFGPIDDRSVNFRGSTGRPVKFKKDRIGGTGQPARFANQSGNGEGKIFGLTTQQALIAIGVGVAAYFIIQKVK